MAIPIIPSLLRDNLAALAADDQRLDERQRFEVVILRLRLIAYTMPKDHVELEWAIQSFLPA